jgi:hypothetical protein
MKTLMMALLGAAMMVAPASAQVSCYRIGGTISCSDGSSAYKMGDTTLHSDGSSAFRLSDTTIFNDQ